MKPLSPRAMSFLGCCLFVVTGCGGSSSSSGGVPATAASVQVRIAEGAPSLQALVNGAPTDLGATQYLAVNHTTVASSFPYGAVTPFLSLPPGTLSLEALDSLGYSVGPLKSPVLAAGKRYTLAIVGSYPGYRVLAFEEPASNGDASLAVYEASPSFPNADFGSFNASNQSGFKKLGSVRLGSVARVAFGKSVSNLGGYVGNGVKPIPGGALTVQSVDSFDARNALPFHAASRLSLLLFDPKPGNPGGPVFGSLDR